MTDSLEGKRLAALDVGTKRIGYATCDEQHIAITPRLYFDATKKDIFNIISDRCNADKIGALIVGIPLSHQDELTTMAKLIKQFCVGLKQTLLIPIIEYDEAFSTIQAFQTMAIVGNSRKKRREKGQKDMVAAAVILRNFIEELKQKK